LLEFNKAKAEGEMVWRKARQNNDFNSFKPYLEKLLDLQITIASIKAQEFNKKIYDVLIDSYDPDQEADNLIPIHNKLKAWLPGFIDKVIEKQAKESFHPLRRQFDKLKQKEFGIRIMKVLGFDFNQGRLDESVHPFCGGTPFDIRITTRYEEDEFILALEGIIHETGHALYELNRPAKYKNQPVGKALGMSMHESQSLFMEMQIGRSFSFMQYLSPLLNEFWGSNEMFTPENLYLNVSRVQKGFIRVDADEVTYPLHVIMRFEIEYALINSQIKVEDIPSMWNEKFKEYFGITPPNDRLGCLQDIHWSWGGFGYFPSYLNGAIIASNLMTKAKEKISNLNAQIAKGEFIPVTNFLKENILMDISQVTYLF
jgi:carboxypeptidase Taq